MSTKTTIQILYTLPHRATDLSAFSHKLAMQTPLTFNDLLDPKKHTPLLIPFEHLLSKKNLNSKANTQLLVLPGGHATYQRDCLMTPLYKPTREASFIQKFLQNPSQSFPRGVLATCASSISVSAKTTFKRHHFIQNIPQDEDFACLHLSTQNYARLFFDPDVDSKSPWETRKIVKTTTPWNTTFNTLTTGGPFFENPTGYVSFKEFKEKGGSTVLLSGKISKKDQEQPLCVAESIPTPLEDQPNYLVLQSMHTECSETQGELASPDKNGNLAFNAHLLRDIFGFTLKPKIEEMYLSKNP